MGGVAIEQLQGAVDELAGKLRRSVVVDDTSVRLLVTSRHFGDEDEVRVRAVLQRSGDERALGHVLAQGVAQWTSAGVIPPLPSIGMQTRVCVPIRWRSELLGFLMVMDADGTLTTGELKEITTAAADMAPHLRVLVESEGHDGEDALWDLTDPHSLNRRQALTDIAERHDLGRFGHTVALDVAAVEVQEKALGHATTALAGALRNESREHPASLLYAIRDSSAVLLLGLARPTSRDRLAGHATKFITRLNDLSAQRFRWVAGIGSTVTGLDLAAESADQAALASTSAASGLMPKSVVFWDELGAYASLLRIPKEGLATDALPYELRRLLEIDSDGQLRSTVHAYLDHAGSSSEAADALHIHRTTLYYRLGRVQELAGLDLGEGRTRLALHVGLEMLRIRDARREVLASKS